MDGRHAVSRDGAFRRRRDVPRGGRGTFSEERARQGCRLQRRALAHHGRRAREGDRRRQALSPEVSHRFRRRRSRVLDGQGARAREEVARRGRSLSRLCAQHEVGRPPRRGLRAARHGAHQHEEQQGGGRRAAGTPSRSASRRAPRSAPTASMRPRTRATCKASASSPSSSRSKSPAT